jgi:segregation and condensation protein A
VKPDLKLVEDTGSQLEVDVFDPPPQQAEMPFAVVDGEPITQLPKDLYIPPDALQVFLEAFEGPLDLLLYLIRRQNLDVLDIPIAEITRQYMHYIDVMQELQLELAGEYLLMAAMLAEIKSRMLLPHLNPVGEEEEDPRAELVRRLQEYERFKKAAEDLDRLPRMERDTMVTSVELVERKVVRVQPQVSLQEMLLAFKDVLSRGDLFARHHIRREQLSVRQRMMDILDRLREAAFIEFVRLFDPSEGRMGVTVTFIAVLELMKEGLLEIVQAEPYAPIHIRPASGKRHLTVVGEAEAGVDFDVENAAALAQPAHPDENDDPEEDAPPAAAVADVASETSAAAAAGEQASLQEQSEAGIGPVAAEASSSAETSAQSNAAQSEVPAQAVEAGVASSEASSELVVAQLGESVGEVVIAAPELEAGNVSMPTASTPELVALEIPSQESAAVAAAPDAEAVAASVAAFEQDASQPQATLEVEPGAAMAAVGDVLAADQIPEAIAEDSVVLAETAPEQAIPAAASGEPAVAPSEIRAASFDSDEHAALAVVSDEVVSIASGQAAMATASEPDALQPIAACVAAEAVADAGGEDGAGEVADWSAMPLSEGMDLDVSLGAPAALSSHGVVISDVADSVASDARFEYSNSAAVFHADTSFDRDADAPVQAVLPQTELADVSYELAVGTLFLEAPPLVQFPSGLGSDSHFPEPADSVGAALESGHAALNPTAVRLVDADASGADEAAMGTSPAEPVAESSAALAAEDSPELVSEFAAADLVLEQVALDAADAELSLVTALPGASVEPEVAATLDLEPVASVQAATASGEVVLDQQSVQVEEALIADQPASQLSDPGLESRLLAMTVIEAADVQTSPADVRSEAGSDPEVVATLDVASHVVSEEVSASLQATAAFELEGATSQDAVVSELSDDLVIDDRAPVAADYEAATVADQPVLGQPGDTGFEPELLATTAFEAAEAKASATFVPSEASAEPELAATLDFQPGAPDEAPASLPAAAAFELEVATRQDATSQDAAISELSDDLAAHSPAPVDYAADTVADPPGVQQLSEAGLQPELPAMTAFEATEAEAGLVAALSEARTDPEVAATLDVMSDVVSEEVSASSHTTALFELEVATSQDAAVSELSDDLVTDDSAPVAADHEAETVGGEPSVEQLEPVSELPAMTAFEAAEVEASPAFAVSEAGAEPEVAETLDLEPVVPDATSAASGSPLAGNLEPGPALGASIAEQHSAAQLGDTGLEPALTAFEVVEADASSITALSDVSFEELPTAVDFDAAALGAEADLSQAASSIPAPLEGSVEDEVVTIELGPVPDLEVATSQQAPTSAAPEFFWEEPAAPGLDHGPLEAEPAAAVSMVMDEAVSAEGGVSESDSEVDIGMLELGPAALVAVGEPPQVPTLEAAGHLMGDDETSLEVEAIEARDLDVPAVATSSSVLAVTSTQIPSTAGSWASLPEQQQSATTTLQPPATTTVQPLATMTVQPLATMTVQPHDAAPQSVAALSATRDAAPHPEQLVFGSVTALLDEYPVGAVQLEQREPSSVESVYEVDVAAFSSPLAFEHCPLRDDSD